MSKKNKEKIKKEKQPKSLPNVQARRRQHRNKERNKFIAEVICLVISAALIAVSVIPDLYEYSFWFIAGAYIVCGIIPVGEALQALWGEHKINESFLVMCAVIGAFVIGVYYEGAAVLIFFRLGRIVESFAVAKSSSSIRQLTNIRPETVNVIRGDEMVSVLPDEVEIGELICVFPGEIIPLDGTVILGESNVDVSSVTGEAPVVRVGEGNNVVSGSKNISGWLTIKTSVEYGESTVAKMVELTRAAAKAKSRSESVLTSFSRFYAPIVFVVCTVIALVPIIALGLDVYSWIYRAISVLVILSPGSITLSIPFAYLFGRSLLSRLGILIKGGATIDNISKLGAVVFDKTGTLTQGNFKASVISPRKPVTEKELIRLAAGAEAKSQHPIAAAIKKAAEGEIIRSGGEHTEFAGLGVKWVIDGKEILVGNSAFMDVNKVGFIPDESDGTAVYVVEDSKFLGFISVADPLRDDAQECVAGLHKLGVNKLAILTGDRSAPSAVISKMLSISDVHSRLLPHEKAEFVKKLHDEMISQGYSVAFAGDGINDAAALATADVGISMGRIGADAAIESSDMIIVNDMLSLIPKTIKISRLTRRKAVQNLVSAITVKVILSVLCLLGLVPLWGTVFTDIVICLLAVANCSLINRSAGKSV